MDQAEALFEEGQRALPAWNEADKATRARRLAEGIAILERAFALGHHEAGRVIAGLLQFNDIVAGYRWAIDLAKLGDEDKLISILGDANLPVVLGREVVDAATRGEPWAQTTVARLYVHAAGGLSLREEIGLEAGEPAKRGRVWMERAVKQAWPSAQWLLAITLAEEDEDGGRAIDLAREAAREGAANRHFVAHALALWLQLLDDAGRPPVETVPARTRLAESGHSISMVWLGDRYRLGEGVAQSFERAREWYERAGEKGEAAAYRELGKMYESGAGVGVDDDKARAMYESAAEMGADAYARKRLVEKYGLTWYGSERKKGAGAKKQTVAKKRPKAKTAVTAKKGATSKKATKARPKRKG